MQLVVLPQLSRNLSASDYGVMLTATGFMNILINAFGGNLGNSRLRQQAKYDRKHLTGDYQLMVLATSVIAVIAVLLFNIFLKADIASITLPLALITVTGILRSYYMVTYRIEVNYKRNLVANIFCSIGYCIGGIWLIKRAGWPWVFLLADMLTLAYIIKTSRIIQEPLKKTELFTDSVKITVTLLVGGLIGNITTYLDRFIIYPTLGSESVSTYATAAWFSKSVLMVMMPITTVLLSYLTAGKLRLNKRKYNMVCLILLAGVVVCWIGSIIFAPFITGFMYPTLIDAARPYIAYVSLSVVIGIMGNFLSVMVFAYAPIRWQTIIPIVKVLIYLVLGVLLVNRYGIMGMIIAVFTANLVCNIISYFVAGAYVREDAYISKELEEENGKTGN